MITFNRSMFAWLIFSSLMLIGCIDNDRSDESADALTAMDPANQNVVGLPGDRSSWRGTSGTGQVPTTLHLGVHGECLHQPDCDLFGTLIWPNGDERCVIGDRTGKKVSLSIKEGEYIDAFCRSGTITDRWVLDFMGDTMVGTGEKPGVPSYTLYFERVK